MKIIFRILLLLSIDDIYGCDQDFPTHIFPIVSFDQFSRSLDYYDDMRTLNLEGFKLSNIRNRIYKDLKETFSLKKEESDHYFIQNLMNNVKRFKNTSSVRQMSHVVFLSPDIKGKGVKILVLEPSSHDHLRHVSSIVRQIAPDSIIEKDLLKDKPDFKADEYKVVNASCSGTINNPHFYRVLGSTSLLVQASGNEMADLTQLYSFVEPLKHLFHQHYLTELLKKHPKLLRDGLILVGNLGSGHVPNINSNRPGEEKDFQDSFIWTLGTDVLAKVSDTNIRMTGTSMAAPVVSGVAALIAGQYSGFTKMDIKECLLNSARKDFWIRDYENQIFVHVSPEIKTSSIDCSRDDYLLVHEPYNSSVWGKGILDAQQALLYASFKSRGKITEDFLKIIAEKEVYSAKRIQKFFKTINKSNKRAKKNAMPPWWKEAEYKNLDSILRFAATHHFDGLLNMMKTRLFGGNLAESEKNIDALAILSQISSTKSFAIEHMRILLGKNLEEFDKKALFQSALKGTDNAELDLFKLVLEKNVDQSPEIHQERRWRKILDQAIFKKDWGLVHQLIDKDMADIVIDNEEGFSVLHLIGLCGNKEEVEFLCDAIKKQIDRFTKDTASLLSFAKYKNHTEFLEKMSEQKEIEQEGTLEQKNRLKQIFLEYLMNKKSKRGQLPLFIATIDNGDKEVIETFLKYGAMINIHKANEEPLIYGAIKKGDAEIVEFLIENGADLYVYYNNQTLFECAQEVCIQEGYNNFEKIMYKLEEAHRRLIADRKDHKAILQQLSFGSVIL